MKPKFNKLCSFDMDIAEKLNKEPSRRQNDVIVQAVKAHYENRIIPKNCKVSSLDVTDWVISEIKKSEQVDKLDFSLKTSSFVVINKDIIIDKVIFYLKSKEIEIEIKFNVIVENGIEILFIRWVYDTNYKYDINFDNTRLQEIENAAMFKL